MRELEEMQKAKVYTSTMIRVQTPDRTVLQGVFSPLEAVAALHAWVRGLLRPDLPAPFYLYTTPPPTLLPEDAGKTLADARLQPAVLLYLGWGTGPGGGRALDFTPAGPADYLTAEALAADGSAAAPGATAFPSALPVVDAPVMDVDAAAAALLGGRAGGGGGAGAGAARAPAAGGAK